MKECNSERSLRLTEEEALGLLDLVMLSTNDLSAEQRAAVVKLSEFCRQFLREDSKGVETGPARTLTTVSPAPNICAA